MGKEPQAQPAPGSAPVTARFRGAESSLPLQRLESSSRKHKTRPSEGCASYRPPLTPAVSVPAAFRHGRPWAGGGEVLSLLLLSSQGRRLLAVGGFMPALGAVLSHSEDVAVALVGRTREEKGGES